jgi:hypothetical protein
MNMPTDDVRTGLQPPRFGLASLMVLVAVLGGMFALIRYVGWHGSAIAIFFLLCVVAHVAGNALGTRLRAIGSEPPEVPDEGRQSARRVAPQEFAPATELREKRALGRPVFGITILGALLAGAAGGYAFWWLADRPLSLAALGLGAGACAVLGGIWTFAAGSFIQVTCGAWFRAARGPAKKRK